MRSMFLSLAILAIPAAALSGCCFELVNRCNDDGCAPESPMDTDGNGDVDEQEVDEFVNGAGLTDAYLCSEGVAAGYGRYGDGYMLEVLVDLSGCIYNEVTGVKYWLNEDFTGPMDYEYVAEEFEFDYAEELTFVDGVDATTMALYYPPADGFSIVTIPHFGSTALGLIQVDIDCADANDYNCDVTVYTYFGADATWD